jgi:ribosomal protein L18E
MPIYMRLGKKRGPYSKDAMPVGPHRTSTVPVNLRDLERVFENGEDVTLESLREKGLIKNTKTDVKILGTGELKKKLSVTAHAFSATAREKIEAAGGKVTALREPVEKKKRTRKAKPKVEAPEAEAPEAEAAEATEDVAAGQAPPGEEAETGEVVGEGHAPPAKQADQGAEEA